MPIDNNSEPKLRAVLDSNVLVSAFSKPDGILAPLWFLARDQRYTLLISPAIVKETARILRTRFDWDERRLQERIRVLVAGSDLITPAALPAAVPDDPDDNHIIACAVEGRADLIASGDRHLLTLGQYAGIPIVRPVDFLRTLGHPAALRTETPSGRR
jgi:putative PIN family toxin of toxin-antitoxin system